MNRSLSSEFSSDSARQQVLILGNLQLDENTFRISVAGTPLDTTFHEFELMRLLFESPNRIIPYEFIARTLFGRSDRGALKHLHVLVHRLRTKLKGSNPFSISTVRNRGYGLLSEFRRNEANG